MNQQALINYSLHLGDNALIMAQRNAEWCGHGPVLEQDIAITNISLDQLGQARNFYEYAARLKNDGSSEDSLAYLRTEREFKNCLLTELPGGDWAQTILRQFFFSAYQDLLYERLATGPDQQLAAIAGKASKEVTYHLRWSGEWVIRLGDGTDESHGRVNEAIDNTWAYTGELFTSSSFETELAKAGVLPAMEHLQNDWLTKVQAVFSEATLSIPQNTFMQFGGKEGRHTEQLGYILAEMQYLQRTYPGVDW